MRKAITMVLLLSCAGCGRSAQEKYETALHIFVMERQRLDSHQDSSKDTPVYSTSKNDCSARKRCLMRQSPGFQINPVPNHSRRSRQTNPLPTPRTHEKACCFRD